MRHHLSNVHLYENQVEIFKNEQMNREPLPLPKLNINPEIKTFSRLNHPLRTRKHTQDTPKDCHLHKHI
jgi:hypothetical protein